MGQADVNQSPRLADAPDLLQRSDEVRRVGQGVTRVHLVDDAVAQGQPSLQISQHVRLGARARLKTKAVWVLPPLAQV